MVWVRLDDHFDQHPKIAAVGPLGLALWVTGLAYCNRNQTDGFIPWSVARQLVNWQYVAPEPDDQGRRRLYTVAVTCGMSGGDVTSEQVVDLLCASGVWDEVDDQRGLGYEVHDYGNYQPLRADIESQRAAVSAVRSEAGRKGAEVRWNGKTGKRDGNGMANAQQTDGPVPDPVPVPIRTPANAGVDAAIENEEGSEAPTAKPAPRRKGERRELSEEQRATLLRDFKELRGAEWRIDKALNSKASAGWLDIYRGVRNWLNGDLDEQKAGETNGYANGRANTGSNGATADREADEGWPVGTPL